MIKAQNETYFNIPSSFSRSNYQSSQVKMQIFAIIILFKENEEAYEMLRAFISGCCCELEEKEKLVVQKHSIRAGA